LGHGREWEGRSVEKMGQGEIPGKHRRGNKGDKIIMIPWRNPNDKSIASQR